MALGDIILGGGKIQLFPKESSFSHNITKALHYVVCVCAFEGKGLFVTARQFIAHQPISQRS